MFPISIKKKKEIGALTLHSIEVNSRSLPAKGMQAFLLEEMPRSSRRAQLKVKPQTQGSTFQEQRHSPEAELGAGKGLSADWRRSQPGGGEAGETQGLGNRQEGCA